MRGKRAATIALVLVALHELGARALDTRDVADRLLASGGADAGAIALLGAFFVVRLALVFLVPGLVMAALLTWFWSRAEPS
jgi:chromate transport protein ChrA